MNLFMSCIPATLGSGLIFLSIFFFKFHTRISSDFALVFGVDVSAFHFIFIVSSVTVQGSPQCVHRLVFC